MLSRNQTSWRYLCFYKHRSLSRPSFIPEKHPKASTFLPPVGKSESAFGSWKHPSINNTYTTKNLTAIGSLKVSQTPPRRREHAQLFIPAPPPAGSTSPVTEHALSSCCPAPPYQRPLFLRNRAACSRYRCSGFRRARASALASLRAGGRPRKPVRFHGLACSSGQAMPACQVRGSRRRARVKEGMARPGASAGPASAAARLRRLEASIRGGPGWRWAVLNASVCTALSTRWLRGSFSPPRR